MWVRWSLRDLRQRCGAVVVIALVIAIGTGVYAGLGSTANWRRESNDATFAALRMHDLRIALSPGTFTEDRNLTEVVDRIGAAGSVTSRAERLVVDS